MAASRAARQGPGTALVLAAALLGRPALAADVTVTVEPDADRRPISPLIYGVSFGSMAQANRLRWPVRRWGGNAVTRYSWEDDVNNRASDWFFYNIENDHPDPSQLPHGSSSDRFIDQTRAAGGEVLLTVPTIGWTPIDRARRWGFSVAKYGPQAQTECTVTGFPPWCNHDAGNGVRPDGTDITGNDPTDTSRPVGPAFVTSWMQHIASRVGGAAAGGVRLFALDNEPFLWPYTHRDVHPQLTSYDEMWTRTRDYARAIKAQDPAAKVLGPADWGWCAYFFSALDGCRPGPDRAAHGNLDFLDWYLEQVAADYVATGVKLLDYLDIHYYPQAPNVALSDDESAATSALRLRTVKSLYDPAYLDESWINDMGMGPVRLIPRLRAWLDGRFTGAAAAARPGLALSEYNWGHDDGVSSALAQAEVLAVLGREGVDLATRWVAPSDGSRVEDAFRLYLDYDGLGGRVTGDSVRATSSNVDQVGAYAIRGGTMLYLLLFNKDTVARTVAVGMAGGWTETAALFRFSAASRLGPAGSGAPAAGVLNLTLPARSATLATAPLRAPSAGTSFHTVTPCRVVDTRLATAAHGGPALIAGVTRTFDLGGRCGIPDTAAAVSLNVAVTAPSTAGNLGLAPAGAAATTSSLNYAAGQTRGNNAVIMVGASAGLSVRPNQASGTVHVILDVNGYFE
ncbi:MAG TPA: glycoside hydrolase family 44 protein [Vicinamibacteria bacterium]